MKVSLFVNKGNVSVSSGPFVLETHACACIFYLDVLYLDHYTFVLNMR